MRQQRNVFQMKEQDKTLEEELSKAEIGNLPEKEWSSSFYIKETKPQKSIFPNTIQLWCWEIYLNILILIL